MKSEKEYKRAYKIANWTSAVALALGVGAGSMLFFPQIAAKTASFFSTLRAPFASEVVQAARGPIVTTQPDGTVEFRDVPATDLKRGTLPADKRYAIAPDGKGGFKMVEVVIPSKSLKEKINRALGLN